MGDALVLPVIVDSQSIDKTSEKNNSSEKSVGPIDTGGFFTGGLMGAMVMPAISPQNQIPKVENGMCS